MYLDGSFRRQNHGSSCNFVNLAVTCIHGLYQNNHQLSHIHLSLCEPFPLGCSSLLAFSAPEAFSSTIFVKASPISHSQGVQNKMIKIPSIIFYHLQVRNLCCQLVDTKSSQMKIIGISTPTQCLWWPKAVSHLIRPLGRAGKKRFL